MSIYDLIITYLLPPLGSYLLFARARRHTSILSIQPASEVNLAIGLVLSVYSVLSILGLNWMGLGWSESIGLCPHTRA